jgi:hypothetical protein
MGAFAADFAGLKCTLHDSLFLLFTATVVIFVKGIFKHRYESKSRTKKLRIFMLNFRKQFSLAITKIL